MTTQQIKQQLVFAGIHPDVLSRRGKVFTFRRSFFFTHGKDHSHYAELITKAVRGCRVLEAETIRKPFRGGASVANQSHFLVRFTIKETKP